MRAAPSVLVLRAAGTNCDEETAFAFEHFGARTDVRHVNELLADPARLDEHAGLAFPGGFSYGDDVGAGAVWACEMRHRLGDALVGFVDRGGLVLGICNGFQVLVRLGLLPGLDRRLGQREVSVTDNDSHKYEDRWVRLSTASRRCVFVGDMQDVTMPVAHAEGRVVCLDDDVARRLEDEDRVVFRYAGADGHPTDRYPENPNGSQGAIAGLTDATGRVLGLMPHPERAFFGFHEPAWTRRPGGPSDLGPGAALFENACAWMRGAR